MNINTSNYTKITYAKEGEPIYQKDMDLDKDGEITMEEFNEYCDENGISPEQRKAMLETKMTWDTFKAMQKAREENDDSDNNKLIYAKKGDLKYKEDMDINDDDKITYEEYIKYCEKRSQSNDNKEPEIKVEVEA